MTDALASVLVEQLAAIFTQEIQQKVRLVTGVRDEVKKLEDTFITIQEVLNEAEHRSIEERNVKRWLDKFKIVAYDMDDVLDEWRTEILRSQIKGPRNGNYKKVFSYFCLIPFPCLNKVALHYDIGSSIKEIRERLDLIRNEKDELQVFRSTTPAMVEYFQSSGCDGENFDCHVPYIVVRDSDKKIILEKLLRGIESRGSSSCNQPDIKTYDPRFISIIGMGGLGKTTLAQLIFHDNQVTTHFEKRMWVCIPKHFDRKMIAKAIIQEATSIITNSSKWNPLSRELNQSVKGKRFLLVLDNVGTDDEDDLDLLRSLLRHGAHGSRIMVTTRKQSVAKRTNSYQYHLGFLSPDDCWLIFCKASAGREASKVLNDIGYEIAKNCKGLPLTASILGSHLRMQIQSEREWRRVLKSKILELEEIQEKLFTPLLLSYSDLQPPLKRCFQYCAIFPRDHRIKKHILIKMWMAQGFLNSTDPEYTGEKYFVELAERSFFHDFLKDDDESIISCKMHELVHEFAQFLTKNELHMGHEGPQFNFIMY